jgi:uroporphyrinogen decarboxylase
MRLNNAAYLKGYLQMKPRERMIAALDLVEPADYCPVWEIEFHLFDTVSSDKLVISEAYTRLSPSEREIALHKNAEIMVSVAKKLGLSALSNLGPYWEIAPGKPAIIWLPAEDSVKFLPILKQAAGDEIFVMEWCPAMIFIPEADNYLEFAYMLFDKPDEVDEMARRQLKKGIEISKRARDAGADGLCAACDIADNRGMYFNPEQLDRFFMPYLEQWSHEVRMMGLQSVLHSDGDLTSVLNKLAATELNGLQAIDPVAGMDIVDVKKKVGDRLCLCGNIDLGLLQAGTQKEICNEVKRVCHGCKTGGGFVLGATNAVFSEIPLGNYKTMLQAGREYGNYL